jgi:hypothetical protein
MRYAAASNMRPARRAPKANAAPPTARSAALVPVHLAEIEARPPIDLSRREVIKTYRKTSRWRVRLRPQMRPS